MIPFQGLLFFYVLGLALIPAVLLGLLEKPLRQYGLLVSVALLAWVFAENGQLGTLALFYLWHAGLYTLFFRLRRCGPWMLRTAILLALLPLALAKVGEMSALPLTLRLLGISYMTFRAVQALIDAYDGRIEEWRLFNYTYFLLFFPAVASGPIDRYRRFSDDLQRKLSRDEYVVLLQKGIWKLMFGIFSSVVLSGLIEQQWLNRLPEAGLGATLSYMYGYTFYLFFNFAGYSSMAIGTAYLLGIALPENFHMPFLSVDMKDFWSRWHISLSIWLRDYLYSRFVRGSLKAKRFRSPRTASYFGYLLNMLAMGIWHGLTPAYLVYGAYHGLLLCANEALDQHCKPFRTWKRQGWAQILCVLVTFHLFSFGLLIFSGRLF